MSSPREYPSDSDRRVIQGLVARNYDRMKAVSELWGKRVEDMCRVPETGEEDQRLATTAPIDDLETDRRADRYHARNRGVRTKRQSSMVPVRAGANRREDGQKLQGVY